MKVFNEKIYEINKNYLIRYVVCIYATNLIFVHEFSYFEIL